MKQVRLIKTGSGMIPADSIAESDYNKYKIGEYLIADIKKPRNPKFHAKFFSLLSVGFEYWEPGEINSKYGKPEKDFEKFREDVTILAGHYKIVIRLDESTQVQAKSISFASIDDVKFSEIYQNVLTVLMQKVFEGWEDEDVIKIAEQRLLDYS